MRSKNFNQLKHLIYFSKPTVFDTKNIESILTTSRKNNNETDVTGALICRSDLYFQFLEGPKDSVEATFQKIKLDTRHSEIYKIKDDLTNRRLFASWAMRDDPVHTWMWTREEVKNGILTRIAPNEAFATFERLSREVDQFTP
ncbi:MAG: blue light sensor protein [Rhodobacteraceae bacterium]|nr:MAG: blue light sensor protein [Paracoccaceae bacterium]|tara:strand:- start:1120 stop:1548 length:429 start_codon:yes stop_codon:yes gene_type:complete